MKWTTLQYANSSDPNVWGPAFWFTLHNGAARYPIKASPICKESMKMNISEQLFSFGSSKDRTYTLYSIQYTAISPDSCA